MTHFTLTPAYGRDYRSKAAVIADLNGNRDFITQPWGQYINLEQLVQSHASTVNVRYQRLTKVAVFTIPELRKMRVASETAGKTVSA